jgi:3-phosphoshikimate 1-carboxyvinyltransferase
VSLDGSRSSQFASGLLLSAPLLPGGLQIDLIGQTVSRPYLDLTLRMMRERGASVEELPGTILVSPGGYRAGPLRVHGDWSAAGFLLAAAFISGCPLELLNLDPCSAQGDRVVVELLETLRQAGPHRFDLTDCPDLLPPLAAAAVFATDQVEIAGLLHARLKESDRPAVLAAGLSAAGVRVVERPDSLLLEPGTRLRPACLDPAGDHRMAMAFGLLSLREPGITVADRDCVGKSYPGFWDDLERFR